MNVALRPEASSDLVSAAAYFNDISDGWGDHFLNTIEVDLADLREEAGIHAMHHEYLASSPRYSRLQSTIVSRQSQRSSTRS